MPRAARIAAALRTRADQHKRFMVAIAGPPGSGKSTLADEICAALREAGETAIVVPMDGFHFDDVILNNRSHRARKGAAHTFDALGFEHLLKRIKSCEPDIAIPVFDRTMELSRAAADIVDGTTKFVLVEGLYLLLNREPWSRLKLLFDYTIFLHEPEVELERRLTHRILSHGHDLENAKNWIASNDMLNMRDVIDNSQTADEVIANA